MKQRDLRGRILCRLFPQHLLADTIGDRKSSWTDLNVSWFEGQVSARTHTQAAAASGQRRSLLRGRPRDPLPREVGCWKGPSSAAALESSRSPTRRKPCRTELRGGSEFSPQPQSERERGAEPSPSGPAKIPQCRCPSHENPPAKGW